LGIAVPVVITGSERIQVRRDTQGRFFGATAPGQTTNNPMIREPRRAPRRFALT